MIRIDARELYQVLELTPPEQNILLVGKHGIGKSEIISHFYRQRQKLPVIPFFLGQMSDPGDLIGLLHKDEKTGRSVFLPPTGGLTPIARWYFFWTNLTGLALKFCRRFKT